MSEILGVVTTIFIGLILAAGVILIAIVALAVFGLVRREVGFAFSRTKKAKLPSFYSRIPASHLEHYQIYLDRAFELSPTLEFNRSDPAFGKLLAEAANNDLLNDVYLHTMIIQYVGADRDMRERYQHAWARKVTARKEIDFFPDPWSVISRCIKERYGGK